MPAFAYEALTPAGKSAKGIIEAASAAAARRSLRQRNLAPLSVEPTKQSKAAKPSGFGKPRIPRRALTLLTRQLATLVGSGIGVEQALKTVADQNAKPAVTSLLLNLRASVLEGRSFAQALGDYPTVFGDFYRASVAAGESSGQLGQVMEHLSSFVETRAKNRQTVQLALLYPAILAVVSLAVIVALLTFVVPDIVRVFTSRGAELPFLTRSLISVSDFINTWGLVVLGGLAALGLAGASLLRQPAIRLRWHRFLSRSMLTRGFSLKTNAVQFAGTLATLTVSRVPLVDALAAAAQTVPNLHIRAKVAQATARVREGVALSQALEEAKVFPPMLIAMVASGEAGGVLGATLTRAADDQERDLNALVAALVALVEPAVLLIMGGIVMLLVLSILLPIVNLNNLVN
ncbi:type II secretion system inner membrane protein GspF [uncultured Sulfitobacter sp.]|jgi:general secretion pathway protein F|uniref:type II secretion system inner membrane protein GspF n=1 Tax=uncultured Sulfitobacter sp. TaxID=191468 RepID=UPI000EE45885|nr:type II secretion system protein GspF [Sulfitobacter sp.]|tara:strand:+ start:2755 stop:3966 length:1212 start_codon:yes stop_codon:yes gene_type:complete